MNHSDAVNYIELHFNASPERDHILAFIRSSERGIIRSLLDD
jgi:hypothetical protein